MLMSVLLLRVFNATFSNKLQLYRGAVYYWWGEIGVPRQKN